MATEEDNFDIDIYGDGGEEYQQNGQDVADIKAEDSAEAEKHAPKPSAQVPENVDAVAQSTPNGHSSHQEAKLENGIEQTSDVAQKIASTDDSTHDPLHLPKQAPQTQGLKRKDGTDDRFVDPGATTALFISELHWWITDDDIRGWANQSQCEDELEDITFSEHKVNGKSKGQAYVLFKSPQAATAAKHKVESFGEGQQYTKKFTVSYTNPFTNPFRTLPKDGPMRNNNQSNNRSSSSGYGSPATIAGPPQQQYNSNSGFRGNRGGYNNNRGGNMPNIGGYNRGGFQQPMPGGFQGAPMGGFQSAPMGVMPSYGGFQNRGSMMGGMRGGQMGMRGGRGAMSPNGMMGMPMGGMAMGGMPGQMGSMAMGMPQMAAGMGMQGMQGYFNYPIGSTAALAGQTTIPSPALSPISLSGWAVNNSIAQKTLGQAALGQERDSINGGYQASDPSLTPISFAATSVLQRENILLKRQASQAGQAGFQGPQAHYNPAFFPQQGGQNGGAGDSSWNPHGAKRTRQE